MEKKSQHFIQRMSFLSSRTCDRVDINQLSWQFKKRQEKKVYVTQPQKCSRYLGCVPCPMYAENWTAELCIIVTRPEPGSRNKCITNLFWHLVLAAFSFWFSHGWCIKFLVDKTKNVSVLTRQDTSLSGKYHPPSLSLFWSQGVWKIQKFTTSFKGKTQTIALSQPSSH